MKTDKQNSNSQGVYAALSGHSGQVTTVKTVHEADGRARLISGDSQGNVRIWQQGEGKDVSEVFLMEATC